MLKNANLIILFNASNLTRGEGFFFLSLLDTVENSEKEEWYLLHENSGNNLLTVLTQIKNIISLTLCGAEK